MTALSDRYELSDQLGAGGMAQVWLGKDRVLGRTVAVKCLLTQYSGDPHFIERFRREAQNAASLNHPNIVGVYDTGSDDGTHYIVMEYVKGKTLRDVIREEGPLLPERVAEIGAEVCAGLSFAHQHGIVHRDIKPANIMITPQGSVKVADFGIARAISGESVTQTAMVLGTAQYFSPEQAQSHEVDARSDIYSVGVVLYEMLTRQVPFTGSSPVAIMYKHVKEAPMLPSRLNPDVPPALEAIVMKAIAKNPDNRYQTAEEMREDLLRALHGRPVEAPPVLADMTGVVDMSSAETIMVDRSTMPRVHRDATPEQKRRRTGLILLAAILLAIVGVAAWAIAGLFGGTAEGTVPDLRGKPFSESVDRLESSGFSVQILDGVFSDKYPAGTVAEQNPVGGTKIDKKKIKVKLAPSLGIETVQVPDVTGMSQSSAESKLRAAGFKIGKVDFQESTQVRRGFVISQNPSGGLAAKGSAVDLQVSSGPPTQAVPSVTGLPLDQAEAKLQNYGFKYQAIPESPSPDCLQPDGYVCRQYPQGGEQQAQGSTVTIYYTSGSPPPTESSPPPTDTSSPTP
ncbi:MAG: Stk1 family PASTA domain-containing Ser/Thr kinase [Actinomycetota bacterium]